MKKIGIGLIGCGALRANLGEYAAEYSNNEQEIRVLGAADVSEHALDKFQEKYGHDTFVTKDYKELIARDDIDAIMIFSPDNFHVEHAVDALKAGKPIYLEKPMGITLEEADLILQVAYESGTKLFLGHNMRYFESIVKMKELIDEGVIGDVKAIWCRHFISYGGDAFYKDWHSQQANINGLLVQKAVHDIDVIHWLAGSSTEKVVGMGSLMVYDQCEQRSPTEPPKQVKYQAENWPPLKNTGMSPIIDVEDHSMVMLQMANGVQASYAQCNFTPDAYRNYTVIGTEGRIENIGDYGTFQIHVYNRRTNGFSQPQEVIQFDSSQPVPDKVAVHGGADAEIVRAYIDFVLHNKVPAVSPISARDAVAAGVLGTESLREGSIPKDIPKLPEELVNYFMSGQVK